VRGLIGAFRSRPERGVRLTFAPEGPAPALTWCEGAAGTSACAVAASDG
jgi:hypothetical protein